MLFKDPNRPPPIFDAFDIIDIAQWSEILLLYQLQVVSLKVCLVIFSSFTVISFVLNKSQTLGPLMTKTSSGSICIGSVR